ncbi:transmembrane amino acid transporter protein-domain-containing protein [Mariannaea sp. PMI_226]|nr:transmembrane amino acid transporter protein-domain-containing protein [Mariannaea sp. PMI_226]
MNPTGDAPLASGNPHQITKHTSKNDNSHSSTKVANPGIAARGELVGGVTELERRKTTAGNAKYHRLGWKRLTIVLIVQAIALGSLSIPAAFATLGMVAGVLCSVGIGLLAIYTAYIVGQVKVTYPQVEHYPAAGGLMFGRLGYEAVGVMLTLQLLLLTASHCLTGTMAFQVLTESSICAVIWGALSAVALLVLAIPPSFAELAILGYIDFASIILAIGITIVATGVEKTTHGAPTQWSNWPKEDINFATAFIAICNIFFAYSFSIAQFSFMDEMHTPTDYMKAIWTLGGLEIITYTVTGALIYSFVGLDVKSPAILSTSSTVAKAAFGVALPVIFISGSINTTVAVRYIHGRIYRHSVTKYVNTTKGWLTWLVLISIFTWSSFIIAEVIPFFSDLIAITSSLLNSGFTLYIPSLMWFLLLKQGKWYSKRNLFWSLLNSIVFLLGMILLAGGTYASIQSIINQYKAGTISSAFSCTSLVQADIAESRR